LKCYLHDAEGCQVAYCAAYLAWRANPAPFKPDPTMRDSQDRAHLIPESLALAVRRLLRASWRDIDQNWHALTAEERRAIGDEEVFNRLRVWVNRKTVDGG
jgi:hypothetical protein